ncbi:MAG: hypothetical protein WDN25_05315 [Acetobacteraceae bacterium]
MPNAPMRAFLGFIAGAIAVLTFHQGMLALLYELGWSTLMPYRTTLVPPLWIPAIVSNCFWGGLWGAGFGLLLPRFALPTWLCGLLMGLLAVLVGWFIVAPLKGLPVAGGWVPAAMLRSIAINGCWGLGVGLIVPLLLPRSLVKAHPQSP